MTTEYDIPHSTILTHVLYFPYLTVAFFTILYNTPLVIKLLLLDWIHLTAFVFSLEYCVQSLVTQKHKVVDACKASKAYN